MATGVLNVFSSLDYWLLSPVVKGVVLDMLELLIKSFSTIYIIRLILKHNLFINYLKIKVKFIGLDIEIRSKQKSTPSAKE
jgi:hypothetical protein